MLNIGIVSLANNHIYDCKMSGLIETINTLDELGIYHTGAGWKQEHIHPVLMDVHGSKIGFLAYVDGCTNPGSEDFPELLLNFFKPEQVIKDVKDLRSKADTVICSIHWGKDYSNFFTKRQREIAHELIDTGVDVIIGHHSHTVQPVEIYEGKPIFYSLGGICYGDFYWEGNLRSLKRKTKLGMIVTYGINEGIKSIVPTKELKGNFITIPNMNLENKLKRLAWWNHLKINYIFIHFIIKIKETVFDRIYEYFFGYYRNTIKQLFSIGNLKKVGYITRDFKS